jgi:hypothetical protein
MIATSSADGRIAFRQFKAALAVNRTRALAFNFGHHSEVMA